MNKKIGLVGCGRWGKNILRDLVALNVQVYACEPIKSKREDAQKNGAIEVFKNHNLLPDVDGYIIVTETSNHYQVILDLIKKNKPIYSEKPLTDSIVNTKHLVEIAENQVFVMHKWRYHGGVQKIAELVRSGDYGQPVHIDIERKQYGIPHKDVDASFILTPHDLSIALHILGQLPVLNYAYGNCDEHRKIHYLNILLGKNPTCKIEISDKFVKSSRIIHVQLEKASLCLTDSLAENVILKPLVGEKMLIEIDMEFPLLKELKRFIGYLDGGPAPMSSLNEELQVMNRLDEARKRVFNQTNG